MKIKLESSLVNKNNVPGPGNYEVNLNTKLDAPKYGFGSSIRDSGNKKM
jgi:hypothetical protein